MAVHNRTLRTLAARLGLADEEKVVNKAAEFERLLQTKLIAGSNMTDTSRTVICLDLAAGIFGSELDMKTAIKYSGLKPAMYNNCRKTVSNMLELNDDSLTTMILCNSLQCSSVQELADRILSDYQKQSKMELDLSLPQYACMAVYQACRVNKVKVSKSKLIEKSRLKPAQWAKLDGDWAKFVDLNFAVAKKKGRPCKKTDIEDADEQMDVDVPAKKEESHEPKIEPYDDWKRRILEAAYKELKLMKEEQNRMVSQEKSVRRSPRKTPQKFSPYKSPTKRTGVRLLFPVDM